MKKDLRINRPLKAYWKLTRIASITTSENEEELAEKVKILPKSALDTLVRDVKGMTVAENADGLQKALFEDKNLPGQTIRFQLSDDVIKELNELSSSTCQKPAATIHHTQRLSLSHNHDPRFLAPLCSEHHAIAHSIDFQYHQARTFALQ